MLSIPEKKKKENFNKSKYTIHLGLQADIKQVFNGICARNIYSYVKNHRNWVV